MSDLQPLVDQLFEETREMCKRLTKEATLNDTIEYHDKLTRLIKVWHIHNERTLELLNKAINKSQHNKKILMEYDANST